ncbi:MAG: lysine biosynthesis protein LysW [bacterium]|nr:lysine biosynthesis protein LysW [bacterium]
MLTTQCPNCGSDVIVEEGSADQDLVSCLNCGAELEIASLAPLRLEPLDEEAEEADEE